MTNFDNFSFDNINKSRKENILKSFSSDLDSIKQSDIDQEISKAIELEVLEKGGKRATLGEIREWSGKKYQKTTQGWKPYGGKGLSHGDVDVTDNKPEKINKEDKKESKVIGKTRDKKDIFENHNPKEHGHLSVEDYEHQVPGYLNMKEYKDFHAAQDKYNNFEVNHSNKSVADALQEDMINKRTAYKTALHNKLKSISKVLDKKEEAKSEGKKEKMDLSKHTDKELDEAYTTRAKSGMSENHPEMKQIESEKEKRNNKKDESKEEGKISSVDVKDIAMKLSMFAGVPEKQREVEEQLKMLSIDKDNEIISDPSKLTKLLNFTSNEGTRHLIQTQLK